MTKKKEQKIRITGTTLADNGSKVTISNLAPEEVRNLECTVGGHQWFSVDNITGRARFEGKYKKLPEPTIDQEILPFAGNKCFRHSIYEFAPASYSPSFMIQHLCGYNYTKDGFKKQAEKLESFGFDCLRSRRGQDGKFWEMWFLSGLWAAEGKLKDFIDELPNNDFNDKSDNTPKRWEKVVYWLCKNISFGTLDVCSQRAAATID